MGGARRTRSRIALLAICIGGLLTLPVQPAVADHEEPADVTQLRAAIAGWGSWLGGIASFEALAEPLPLSSATVAESLDVAATLDTALTTPLTDGTVPNQHDVGALAAAIEGLSSTVGDVDVSFDADPNDASTSHEIALTITLSRALDLPVRLEDPDALEDGLAVDVDAPAVVSFTTTATFVVNDGVTAADPAWIVTGDDEPSVGVRAVVDPRPAALDGVPGAVGVADVVIGGTIDLDVAFDGVFDDPDGDGRLAFLEVASDGTTQVFGELTLAPDQLLDLDRSGTASAALTLTSPVAALGGPVGIAVPVTNLASSDPVAQATGAAVDLEALASFQRIGPVDLLNGLVQYATLLRGVQTSTKVDFALPLVSGRSSDLLDLAGDLTDFVDDRVGELPTGGPDDPTLTGVVVADLLDFATVGELAALLEAEDWVAGSPVSHDSEDELLTLGLHLAKSLEAAGVALPPVPDNANPGSFLDNPAGYAQMANQLVTNTGLRGVNHVGGPTARTTRTAYDVTLPLIVNLQAPCDTGDCADDDLTTPVVEYQDPMPYERFHVPTGGTSPQISITTLLSAPITAAASIGFVPAAVTGDYTLGQDGGHPSTSAVLDATAVGLDATPRIGDLLRDLAGAIAPATRRGTLNLALAVDAHGADPADHLTPEPGAVTIVTTFADASDSPGGPYTPTTDPTADLLRSLHVDPLPAPGDLNPPQTSALLGRILDTADAVASALSDLPGDLSNPLPVIGTDAEDVLGQLIPLAEKATAVRTGPTPVDLAALETALESQLDIGSDALRWRLLDLAGGPGLIAQLDIAKSATSSQPVRIDMGMLGGFNASGVNATVAGSLDLGVVVPLTAPPAGPPQVLRDGGLSVTGSLLDETGALQVTGHAGPFSATLGHAPSSAGRLHVETTLAAGPSDPDPTVAMPIGGYLSALSLSASGPEGGASCEPAIDGAPDSAGTFGCISAPLSLNGTFPSGDPDAPVADDFLTVEINGLAPGDIDVALPPALDLAALDLLPLSFASFTDGIASIRALLRTAMALSTFGAKLPLIGSDLEASAKALEKVDAALGGDFSFAGVPSDTATVETFLYETVRPELASALTSAGILRDSDYPAPSAAYASFYDLADHTPGPEDIRIVAICKDGELCDPADLMGEVDEVTIELELGQGARDPGATGCDTAATDTPCGTGSTIDLNLGLDGLPLRFGSQVTADAGWTIELGVGISRTDGFFLLDNPVPGTGTPDVSGGQDASEDELRVGVNVSLAQDPDGPEATGVLGFLEVTAEDQPEGDAHASGVGLLVQMGLGSPGASCTEEPSSVTGARNCTGRVTLGQLLTTQAKKLVSTPIVTGDLTLDVRLEARVGSGGQLEPVTDLLPKFVADLEISWIFSSDAVNATDAPSVDIAVSVDAQSLFDNAIGNLIRELDKLTDPVDPIREFLFAPVPVISDLSRVFGGPDVTYVDLAERFGGVDLQLLRDINDVLEFISKLAQAAKGPIELGSFSLDGNLAKGPKLVPGQIAALYGGVDIAGIIDDVIAALPENSDVRALFESFAKGTESPFTFPALDEPTCLLGLLLGEDCPLVEWRPGPLEVGFEFDMSFGPFFGVIYVTLGGHAKATGNLSMGFSTRGIRLLAEDILSGGSVFDDLPSIFLQSVYLGDLDAGGKDIPELTLSAGIKAGGKLSILIAEAGVEGGIDANVDLDLRDGPVFDGRLYIDEIFDRIHNPFCLFDVKGALTAWLRVYATLGICPFCHTESYELARVTLLEFASECPDSKPVLASVIGGEVVLNVGDGAGGRASARGPDWDDKTEESYVVRQVADHGDGTFDFSVSAFGHTQPYTGTSIRVITAGSDHDSFVFQGLKAGGQAGQSPDTGDADDAETAPFTAAVYINDMGSGNDVAKTGDGDDIVYGGADDDLIDLGRGNDFGDGGSGHDILLGGPGTDTLHGGPDNDTLDGGLGADFLYGGDGHDRISGGSDLIKVPGQPPTELDGGDHIEGGMGNDTIEGGSGNDTIHGDEPLADDSDGIADTDPQGVSDAGADRITGGAGSDTVFAGNGDDLVIGGFADPSAGNDTSADFLHGNGGADTMYGRDGDDHLFGGSGPDRLFGEGGNDQVHGQGGDDPELRGGSGDDDIFGGSGDDRLFGDADNDNLTGDGGDDGDPASDQPSPGEDELDGGAGNDILLGDNGLVDKSGGSRVAGPDEDIGEPDLLRGGAGNDELYGEGGGDTLYGGSGSDLIHGNGGADVAYGDNGADEIWGDADNDVLVGGPDHDLVYGNAGADIILGHEGNDDLIGGSNTAEVGDEPDDEGDLIFGQGGHDRLYGDNVTVAGTGTGRTITVLHHQADGTFGGDLLDGGSGRDLGYGQDGHDHLYGGDDHDQLFGDMGDDHLYGQGGPDVLFGDRGDTDIPPRAVVVPTGGLWSPGTPKGSPAWDVEAFGATLVEPHLGGEDVIEGGAGDDHGFGGFADDTLSGGSWDDHLEGNAGRDRIFGYAEDSTADDGQDDLIGGSSSANPEVTDPAGAPDAGEREMQGNGNKDVMTGDNSELSRLANAAGTAWLVDPVTGGHQREVVLYDTEKTGAALAAVSGDDLMAGNDDNDWMFGEGGDDLVKGNDGDDLVEGNQGSDWIEGNDGADDLIGGSSHAGQPDGGDQIHGGAGPDVMVGDNGCIVRQVDGVEFAPSSCRGGAGGATEFTYVTYQLGIDPHRGILLRDLAELTGGVYGDDVLSGGAGVDVQLGQDGDDKVQGGPGDDYQQGNGGADLLVGDGFPDQVAGLTPVSADLQGEQSTGGDLDGPDDPDGQDDQIGGSNIPGHRDTGDVIYGDGEADFQLGDNGQLTRSITDGAYDVYEERYPDEDPPANAVIERLAERYDVGGDPSAYGDDLMYGGDGTDPKLSVGAGDGDDSMWGQDGNDVMYGEDDDDDMYGELGNDEMWGGAGEDAMIGDRGGIESRYVDGVGDDPNPADGSFTVQSPPGIAWSAWVAHPLDRRVSLTHERYSGEALALPGLTHGGNDRMRGGPGHDSMHGAFGDDLMNGDSGGDYLFGDDGADVMWGGRGNAEAAQPARDDPGANQEFLDISFGGHGHDSTEAGADIMDYQPRPGVDPDEWFDMTADYEGFGGRQHHHGTDWLYGGWDRDVLQGDVTANGPNNGDKLLDWTGAYNLYTHCNAAYGGWNDVRKLDPNNLDALERLAFALGAGRSLADVRTPGTSGYRQAAIVYKPDHKHNSGKAFNATPGHFQQFICSED